MGDTLKKCEVTGSWSRNILTCDIIECPQPRAPSGGRVSGYNREIHSKIEYSCLPGHVLEGEAMVNFFVANLNFFESIKIDFN